MIFSFSGRRAVLRFTLLCIVMSAAASAQTPTGALVRLPKTDAKGNALRRAATGHVSNYDEAKVGAYTLPDPLVSQSGAPVRDADTWFKLRRGEILALYEKEIFGRVPATAPKILFTVIETDPAAMDGKAVRKTIVGKIGEAADAPSVRVVLLLPAKATGPVPVLLQPRFYESGTLAPIASNTAPARATFAEDEPTAELLGRGYGYATYRYTEFEGDSAATSLSRVRGLALAPGQTKPAADEWGTISAWAWGASRVLDFLETDRAVDAKRVALIGHSRLGKTALWAGACDSRFALVFASCAGELGSSLARRDYGESVDDVAASFPWWLAGNFQKYAGHWTDLPVDAHLVIALCAPRPVFITGGTEDQWADPHGEFLAEVAAGPVYRLLGKKDLGTTELPPLDTPVIGGDLGFYYHTGKHAITAADWKAFLDFAGRHLHPTPPPRS